jgi:hypothetical protein
MPMDLIVVVLVMTAAFVVFAGTLYCAELHTRHRSSLIRDIVGQFGQPDACVRI